MQKLSRERSWAAQRTISQIHPHLTEEDFWASGKSYYLEHLAENINPSDVVLDFGCGVGRIAKHVECSKMLLYDINEHYLKNALREVPGSKVIDPWNYDELIDVTYAISVFIHMDWQTAEQIFKRLARISKCMLLQMPIYDVANEGKDWIDVTTYYKDQILVWARDVGFSATLYTSPGKFSYNKVGQCHEWTQVFTRNEKSL